MPNGQELCLGCFTLHFGLPYAKRLFRALHVKYGLILRIISILYSRLDGTLLVAKSSVNLYFVTTFSFSSLVATKFKYERIIFNWTYLPGAGKY